MSAELLRGSGTLAAWVLRGGPAPFAPLAWRLRLRWQAWWFERLWRLQRARMPAARPRCDPVLVLGLWRSGTTLLHERLSALPGHQAATTWQCFNPAAFLLAGPPGGPVWTARRPMDAGVVRGDSAQEDEFALLLLGAPSLYRGFIDPRRLLDLAKEAFDEPAVGAGSGPWLHDWLRFLAAVEAAGAGRRLVLKSPNHTLRLGEVEAALPSGLQVWIGRPLRETWPSNLRMWRAMFEQYALWPCPPRTLEAFLTRCVERYMLMLGQALSRRDSHHMIWVDFEDLDLSGAPLLDALCAFVGPGTDCSTGQRAEILHRHPFRAAEPERPDLPAELQARAEAIDGLHARARARWGWRQTCQPRAGS